MIITWRPQAGRQYSQHSYAGSFWGRYDASLGDGGAIPPTTTLRGRRRKVPLYNVTFDGAQVAVESAAELKELARLTDSIPKVALMPSVDYGKKISALRRAIVEIETERVKQIDLEDEEALILMFH